MTQVEFNDLGSLGRKIQEFYRAMENLCALKEGRMQIAKNLRNKYPLMMVDTIHHTIWRQEEDFAKAAQLAFDEMRSCAYSLGWNIDYKDVHDELTGILRKPITNLNDINV